MSSVSDGERAEGGPVRQSPNIFTAMPIFLPSKTWNFRNLLAYTTGRCRKAVQSVLADILLLTFVSTQLPTSPNLNLRPIQFPG